ncbi:hypothetical protein BMS3Abin05_00193 [bacterium BMS3Abin05]|nr:hypothetical protein BMS3Abin05_00193 [bacterium BMS3Abin05]GBE28808.1 hypothetical protein BMS3Bbin03_02760 [bacterium BMS3Bbin03]HDK36507.1 hypothetical protein [Bacteroidota bacterium]HDL78347.1 hypothetical protein [Bacteroidota bacterium]HDZ11262.1 hypothetical protein [Bacteroidota bacterium]
MLDIIKKSIYLGLGGLTVTKEKVTQIVDDLIEKGQLDNSQRSKAVQELLDRVDKERANLHKTIKAAVEKVLNEEIQIATKKDIQEIIKRLEQIEKKLS